MKNFKEKTVYDYFWANSKIKDLEEVEIIGEFDFVENCMNYSYLEWDFILDDYKIKKGKWHLPKSKFELIKGMYINLLSTTGEPFAKKNIKCVKI